MFERFEEMKLNAELLEKTFDHLNDLVFGNEIKPRPEIKIYGSKVNQGFFDGSTDDNGNPEMIIRISRYYNKDYNTFCSTLLHEMVHCYQFVKRIPVDHDKSFILMAKAIKKTIGIDIN
jgi:SprT-like family